MVCTGFIKEQGQKERAHEACVLANVEGSL